LKTKGMLLKIAFNSKTLFVCLGHHNTSEVDSPPHYETLQKN
jgi:hypothetical protein